MGTHCMSNKKTVEEGELLCSFLTFAGITRVCQTFVAERLVMDA